jgi:signal transduction histidine kinase
VIEIECRENEDQITISLRDEGPGIASADQKRVFDLFRRLQNSNHITGAGVGLAAVQKRLKGINGSVTLRSSPGAGTEFIISFPA